MSTLYVAEYEKLLVDANGNVVMAPHEPPLVEQTVSIGMSSAAALNPFSSRTKFVQLSTDAICSVLFGNPSGLAATSSNQRLPAGAILFKGVNSGDSVAVITNS